MDARMTPKELSDHRVRSLIDLRAIHNAHDPLKQNEYPGRCALCQFTRHPCDAYIAAEIGLELLAVQTEWWSET